MTCKNRPAASQLPLRTLSSCNVRVFLLYRQSDSPSTSSVFKAVYLTFLWKTLSSAVCIHPTPKALHDLLTIKKCLFPFGKSEGDAQSRRSISSAAHLALPREAFLTVLDPSVCMPTYMFIATVHALNVSSASQRVGTRVLVCVCVLYKV